MPTTSLNQGLTLPVGTDVNNVPGAFTSYNTGVESRLVQRFLSSADRGVRNPTPVEGELSYLIDANRYEYYTGAVWTPLTTAGFVGETLRTVNSPTFTTIETVIDSFTFTAVSSIRYQIHVVTYYQSTVANDTIRLRIRWEAGATLTTTGTEIFSALGNCDVSARGEGATLLRTVTGLSGQVTVGYTGQRNSGTGTLTMTGSSAQISNLLVTSL